MLPLYCIGALTALLSVYKLSDFVYTFFLRPSSLPRYLHGPNPSTPGDNGGSPSAWALVTGASDGIGYGFAQELLQRGFSVVLHGRNPSKLSRVQDGLREAFPGCHTRTVVADAADPEGPARVADAVSGLHLTVLINNVGGTTPFVQPDMKPFSAYSAAEIGKVIQVNAVFPTVLTRLLLPALARDGVGGPSLVVNVGSASARGIPYVSVYAGAKAFNHTWSRAMGLECDERRRSPAAVDELLGPRMDIEVLGVVVGSVRSAGNRAAPGFFVPTSRVMAKAMLDRVGCGRALVTAYWPHGLQLEIVEWLPESVTERYVMKELKRATAEGRDKTI